MVLFAHHRAGAKAAHRYCHVKQLASNQYVKPEYRWVRRGARLVRELDEDEWPDIERIVGLRQDSLSWQQTSDAMFDLECQRLAKRRRY
jgi:hypothetical protein